MNNNNIFFEDNITIISFLLAEKNKIDLLLLQSEKTYEELLSIKQTGNMFIFTAEPISYLLHDNYLNGKYAIMDRQNDGTFFNVLKMYEKKDNNIMDMNQNFILEKTNSIIQDENNKPDILAKVFKFNEETNYPYSLSLIMNLTQSIINNYNTNNYMRKIFFYNELLNNHQNTVSSDILNYLADFSYVYGLRKLFNNSTDTVISGSIETLNGSVEDDENIINFIDYKDILTCDFSSLFTKSCKIKLTYGKTDDTIIEDNYGITLNEIMDEINVDYKIKNEYNDILKNVIELLLTVYIGIYDKLPTIKINNKFKGLIVENNMLNSMNDKLLLKQLKTNSSDNGDRNHLYKYIILMLSVKHLDGILTMMKEI